jgi:NitT/TauT family transport system substrate-binding protein
VAARSPSRSDCHSATHPTRSPGSAETEKINPDIISLNGDSARGDALLASGQLDVGIFGLEKVLGQAAAGNVLPEIAVYNVQNKSQYEGIVLKSSPIQTIADLKGKKVGIPQLGATNETYVNAVIATAGLQPTDVTYIATGIGIPMGEALKNGDIDAGFSTRGQMGPIIIAGYDVRFMPRPAFADSFVTGNVVARSDLPADKVACLKGYLRAYTESLVFSKANPKAGIQVNWHMFPDAIPTNVSYDQALQTAVDNYTAYLSYINPSDGKWGFLPAAPLQSYVDYLGLTGKVDITKFYTNDYIDYANDFDKTAIETMAKNYVPPAQ